MDPVRRREPEPVEIVLVALDAAQDPTRATNGRPPPAGAGTMPAIGHLAGAVVGTVVTRITSTPDPPLLPGRAAGQPWSDQRLHRLVRVPPWDAAPALREVLRSRQGRIQAPTTPRRVGGSRRRSNGARLVLDPTMPAGAPHPISGVLHVHRRVRSTPVELTLEPWSAHQTGLCLQPRRGRFGVHLPRRYYDVAHRVMDEVWHLIEHAHATRSSEETT